MDTAKLYKGLHKGHIRQNAGREHSAQRICALCEEYLAPASVVDVGCGVGHLLAEFHDLDREICGVEGDWLEVSNLKFPEAHLVRADLEQTLALGRKFDLCVSTEVAEHLEPERAEGFVADLTSLSDAVVFSAAIDGQGGTGHKNEQWQDYWVRLFEAQGYEFYDALRPRLWADPQIMDWFKQNLMLFIKPGTPVKADLSGYASTADGARMIVPKYHDKIVRRLRREIRRQR